MPHLDAALYLQIKEHPDQVPAEVCNHLRAPCPECETYLAGLPAEQRDNRIDALLREPEPAALPPFALTPGDQRGPRLVLTGILILSVLAFAGLVEAFFVHATTVGPRPVMPEVPPVGIQVTVIHPDGRQTPGQPHEVLHLKDKLSAQAQLARNTYVSLVRAGDNAGFEPLVLNQKAKTAVVEFAADGQPVTVPLDNLNGSQHLLVLTCDRPIAIDEAISAAKGVLPPGLGMASFDFQVER